MKTTILTLSLFILAGCGSLATKSKDESAVKSVKKVAVVAFSADYPVARTLSLDVGSGKLGGDAGGGLGADSANDTNPMYDEIGRALRQKMHWSIMDVNQMRDNTGYKETYKAFMEGWQQKIPPAQGRQRLHIKGVLDNVAPKNLGYEQREKLLQALGVDAIVFAYPYTSLEGTVVMGIGTRYPQTQITLYVYKRGAEGPIWFETFKGEPAKESVGATGFIDENKMKNLALESAKTALRHLDQSMNR